tara:strand:+ start:120 stop:452 length:333 start_codon:yes stop_codon:yes gene_type:complete
METVTLVVVSVITTLCIGSLVYLIFSVRSLQNKIKTLNAMVTLREQEDDNLYRALDSSEKETNRRVDRDLDSLSQDVDKRFDKSYRAMYEFRDWASEQINRLIEKDQLTK